MKKFMLKSLLIAALMFISVLAGMQIANDGIHEMKGYKSEGFSKAAGLENGENGEINASLLGNEITAHDLKEKKQQLEDIQGSNLFSVTGKKITKGISTASKKIINSITGE